MVELQWLWLLGWVAGLCLTGRSFGRTERAHLVIGWGRSLGRALVGSSGMSIVGFEVVG